MQSWRASERVTRLATGIALIAASVVSTTSPTPVAWAAPADAPTEAIAGGPSHQCAVLTDRTVRCWGGNDVGQLGDGTTTGSQTPVAVAGLTDVVAIDAGSAMTCALTASGTVGCWGRNSSGSLGDPGAGAFANTPTFANGLTNVEEMAVGETHVCARLSSGAIRCWGDNDNGQLGDGTTTDTAVPVAVLGPTNAIQISAGSRTTCAVRSGGTLSCWGYNGSGMFGNGTMSGSAAPIDIDEAGDVRQVEVGRETTCVVSVGGAARCAGSGPLGDGTSASGNDFVDVDLPPVLDISVGSEICAVVPDASVWCWSGTTRLVDGDVGGAIAFVGASNSPEPVDGLVGVTAIDAGPSHTCAGTIDRRVRCWGVNTAGELQADATFIAEPGTTVPGVTATKVESAFSTCALTTSATVSCWGISFLQSFLSGNLVADFEPPTDVEGVANAIDVDVAPLHSCAVLSDGTVTCWGLNTQGQLGFAIPPVGESDFTIEPPRPVTGITGADDVATGFSFTCATTSGQIVGGGASCWGGGTSGQLGNGTTVESSPNPVAVTTPNMTVDVELVTAGSEHACGRVNIAFFGRFVHCWGSNSFGELGDGTTVDRSAPVSTGIVSPKAIVTAQQHSCAIDYTDVLFCWGGNDDGQVGTGSTSSSEPTPLAVGGLPATPLDLAAGEAHTCALLADTTVACWGDNTYRQTGQPTGGTVLAPMVVPNVTGAIDIEASYNTTCAVLADNSVTCWGSNGLGASGASPYVLSPADMGIGDLMTPERVRTEPIFRPVVPARFLETRDGLATVDGSAQGGGAVRGGTQIEVPVAGRAGVPDGARFAIVNVTAVRPQTTGFLTVHGCLSPRPDVANLNYSNRVGDGPINVGNESIIELSPNGSLCVFTSATTDITVDVTAYGLTVGGYTPTTPERILESRAGKATDDGKFELGAPVAGGTEIELDVVGRAGIRSTAEAAVLYVAAVTPSGVGYVTVHPCLDERPLASSLNYFAPPSGNGINRGNEILAPLSDDGTVCLYVSTTTHLTVDVMGSTSAATTYDPVAPARLLETRPGQGTVDGTGVVAGPVAAGAQLELEVAGRADVSPSATLAALNVTAVQPAGVGFVTAHPCVDDLPTASSLNFAAPPESGPINGGNEILAPLSPTGSVCLYVSERTHLTVDVVGAS